MANRAVPLTCSQNVDQNIQYKIYNIKFKTSILINITLYNINIRLSVV